MLEDENHSFKRSGGTRSRKEAPEKAVQLGAHVKCMFINTWSTGNKQEEVEAEAQAQMYNLTGIAETWWNS